jgi:hypothetical protein
MIPLCRLSNRRGVALHLRTQAPTGRGRQRSPPPRAHSDDQEIAELVLIGQVLRLSAAPLADDKIPSFVALGRQVAANGPQLTPEQEAARRRMLAAAQIPLENPEKASAVE